MSALTQFFSEIVSALEKAQVPHMLTGSIASTYYSDPRATQDIDLVVSAPSELIQQFADSLDETRFYVGDARRATENGDQFNIVESKTGWKCDIILRKSRAFSNNEFERRQPVQLLGIDTYVVSLEDLILAKLEWARLGESERQIRDVRSMLSVNAETVDVQYLRHWAADLHVDESLEKLIAEELHS